MRSYLNRLSIPAVAIVALVAVITPSGDAMTLLVYALPVFAIYVAGYAHATFKPKATT